MPKNQLPTTLKPLSGHVPTPVALIVQPLVHVTVSESKRSAPVFSDAAHTAYTVLGTSPLTLYTHANVCENCPHPKPLPTIEPLCFAHEE